MAWKTLADGSQIDTVDFFDYIRAINGAPANTLIKMGELEQPPEWAKCTDCGALMDWALTPYHKHPEKKS